MSENFEKVKGTLIGKKVDTFTYTVEKCKIIELALAIGDLKEEYLNGEAVPPTFPTVIEYWGGTLNLGLDAKKVLHGGIEYEYLGEIKAGDVITVNTYVDDAYTKAKMNFVVLRKEFVNQKGELVVIVHSTVIERH